jgi:hypothetical protein
VKKLDACCPRCGQNVTKVGRPLVLAHYRGERAARVEAQRCVCGAVRIPGLGAKRAHWLVVTVPTPPRAARVPAIRARG